MIGQRVRRRAFHRRVCKAPYPVELSFLKESEQFAELRFGLSRETGDESRADGDFRASLAPGANALQHLLGARGALHELEDAMARMLEGHVEVWQQLAFGHQRNHFVDVRVWINVVQSHPDAELAERTAQVDHARLHRL